MCSCIRPGARSGTGVASGDRYTTIGSYSDIPNLVRAGPVKTTPETMAATQKKAGQDGIARARAVDIDFSVLQTVFDDMAIADVQTLRFPYCMRRGYIEEILTWK